LFIQAIIPGETQILNFINNCIDIICNPLIGDPQNLDPLGFKNFISQIILFDFATVNSPVHLNGTFYASTVEIHDESGDDMLPAKMHPINLVSPNPCPQPPFRIGHLPAHFSGFAVFSICDSLLSTNVMFQNSPFGCFVNCTLFCPILLTPNLSPPSHYGKGERGERGAGVGIKNGKAWRGIGQQGLERQRSDRGKMGNVAWD
jgi:hypothetical protein